MGKIIIFQGDSITDMGRKKDGIGEGYVKFTVDALKVKYPEISFLNKGVGGQRSGDILQRWEEDVTSYSPYLVTLLCGINDVWLSIKNKEPQITDAAFYKNYSTMIEACLNCGSKMILMQPFLFKYGVFSAQLEAGFLNKLAIVDALAEKYNLPYIRLYDLFCSLTKTCEPNIYSYDGLHPTIEGRRVIAEQLVSVIVKLL